MSNSNREAAAARIRALLQKTTENGCTEQEALAAAAKAGELMDRYAMTLSDVEIREERCEKRQAIHKRHDVSLISPAIARFFGCKAWFEGGKPQYYGMKIDVEAAMFLTDLCRNAMEAEFRAFMRSVSRFGVDGRTRRKSFMVGMAGRLCVRLNKMAEAREATARTGTGTSLVVVKGAVVEDQFKGLGIRLVTRYTNPTTTWDDAREAGRAAGDRVNLTQGIGSGQDDRPASLAG